jgi:tetratricopeptide (TPR) repeat protein
MIRLRPAKKSPSFAGGGLSSFAAVQCAFSVALSGGDPLAAQRADLSLPSPRQAGAEPLDADARHRAEALAHYATALRLEHAASPRSALEHYLQALAADPANADLAMHTAELAYSFRGRAIAVALLEKAVEANPDSPETYLNLARFCATYAPDDPFENDRAKQVLERALARFPNAAEVQGSAALTLLGQGRREEAVQVLENAASRESADPAYWLELGRAAQQVWPLGQAEVREEHTQRVNPFFERALRHARTGGDEAQRLEIAQFYLLTNQLKPARDLCFEIVRASGNLQARKLLHRLHEAFEEGEESLRELEAIVANAPEDVEYRKLLARAWLDREQPARAVPHLEAALQVGGGSVEDYLQLGETLLRATQLERVVEFCRRGAKLFPEQAMFHVQAAMAHRSLLQWDLAVRAFERAARLAEAGSSELVNHRFYFQYGVTLERAGRHEEAGRQFEKSITVTPQDDPEAAASAMNYLGYMWLELDRHLDKAGELIRKANELQPDSAAYIDSLGLWHYKMGDYPAALRELQRAAALLPEAQAEDAEIFEHLGRVHLALKQPEEASRVLEKARSLNTPDAGVRNRIDEGLKAAAEAAARR